MRFVETPIGGSFVVELDRHSDERGYFARIWDPIALAGAGLTSRLSQISLSRSITPGTLRGMHFQHPPHEEAKLIRCVQGSIYDVVLDLRPLSPTYKGWYATELTAENGSALYVPEGCAHGFQTSAEVCDVLYLISSPFAPDAADGVRWDDPTFGIEWPETAARVISERDRTWPDYDAN